MKLDDFSSLLQFAHKVRGNLSVLQCLVASPDMPEEERGMLKEVCRRLLDDCHTFETVGKQQTQ